MQSGTLGRTYKSGETIVRQGDTGDSMYVIQEGQAEVVVEKEGRETRLRTLGQGEFIGEMAVFEREVRSATVRAVGDVRVLTIDRRSLLRKIQEDPSLAFRIMETMSRRVRTLSDEVARLRNEGQGGQAPAA
jgi:CRP-like cAMP-binding protein